MYDSKDSQRIAVIMSKSNPLAAARQMANVIKDASKARRRAAAARNYAAGTSGTLRAHAFEVTRIFATRAEDLEGARVAPDPSTLPRYINIALILQNGCTSSTQVWTADYSEAVGTFEGMIASHARSKNPAILGAIVDEYRPLLRYNIFGMRATIIGGRS